MFQPDQVPFPPDLSNWALVRDMLTELQERLLNETINGQDAVLHIQVIYEASQSTHLLEESWLHSRPEVGHARSESRQKLDQSYLWFGMLKFLKKVDGEERERFLFTTLPNIIELALRVEEHISSGALRYSQQQRGGTTVLPRQFIASILACSFLCLFPERVRDRTSKLNFANFTHFFKHLPQSSQIAKLRCILHYFERVIDSGLEVAGSIKFHRQVADRCTLQTMEDVVQSDICLCPLTIHPQGVIEDTGSSAVQVDFANRSIGGGVLGRGRVQEEIRFSTCPELIAAMVFMENMEDNEAIVISGFEQFAQCTGYAASLEFAGPFYDNAQRDSSGNLLNTLCAIDATSFRLGGQRRQYLESCVMREVNKAYVGFCQAEPERLWRSVSSAQQTPSERDEDFLTAQESVDEEGASVPHRVVEMADIESRAMLSQGIVEAACLVTALRASLHMSEDDLHFGEMSLGSNLSDSVPCSQSASTPRDDAGQFSQAPRDEGNFHPPGGNGQRLSLPMVVPRPQNGSCDLLEVDYSEWLANFRRRSSQLSDLTSRRSSSSTKHSSEFSSDLEEIYETLVQAEKGQHGIIEEETYGAALSDYAAMFVSSLMREGTSVAAHMLPDVRDFQQGQLPVGVHRPQVIRPSAVRFGGNNGSSDMVSVAEYELDSGEEGDQDTSPSDGLADFSSEQIISIEELINIEIYVSNLIASEMRSGVTEAAEALASGRLEPSQEDSIPDDVYLWFADKIVQDVFSQAVDDLYFQRFTSDCRWRAELSVNREGVRRPSYEERKDSISSSSSCSSLLREHLDSHSKCSSSPSCQSLESDTSLSQQKKGKSISWSNIPSAASVPSEPDSSVDSKSSRDSKSSGSSGDNRCLRDHNGFGDSKTQSSVFTRDDDTSVGAAFFQPSVSESEHGFARGEGKSVSFTLGANYMMNESVYPAIGHPVNVAVSDSRTGTMDDGKISRLGFRSQIDSSDSSRILPVEQSLTHNVTRAGRTLGGEGSGDQGVERTKMLSPSPIISLQSIPQSPSQSAEILSYPFPSEPSGISHKTTLPGAVDIITPSVVSEAPSSSAQLAETSGQSTDASIPYKETKSAETTAVLGQASLAAEGMVSSTSVPSATRVTTSSTSTAVLSSADYTTTQSSDPSLSGSEPNIGSDQQGASSDLNLDCYRAAADIVHQVFQSLPEHINKLSESGRAYRGGPYYGRKYDTFIHRSSKEVAAAVIGASEKGNVVTESYIQTKPKSKTGTGVGVLAAGRASPRRVRSQSPCFSWLTNRLSREMLTNAFVKTENKPLLTSYERRSSEPCQRSVNLSMQAYTSSHFNNINCEDGMHRKLHGDNDLGSMQSGAWRRGSLDSISLDRRRSSCGFKDPTLSKFAQELMNTDTSVPQLFFMTPGSTNSTTESRRSSLSGFRDTTLATFESELLNSSFGGGPSSPRHRRPKRSLSRESRLWKSDSSETEYWFPIPRRVGSEFQQEMQRLNRHYSVEELEDYADFIANTILQQAVAILHHDMQEVTQEDADISIFSENLADQIMREALIASSHLSHHPPSRVPLIRSISGSELNLSLSSNDFTGRSLDDRLTDFQDAMNVPYSHVEAFAAKLAHDVLSSVLNEFGATVVRLLPGRRPIATGNWGCGAFHGDPCLKVALQWIAASLTHAPHLLYYTFGDPRLYQIAAVTDMITQRQWTVGQLMMAVQAYCLTVLSDDSWFQGGATASAADANDIPLQSLFDFLLTQP